MTETVRHDLELAGCTPEPLMAYLKALGILRLVSEQKDAEARGWWKNDTFWLRSTLDDEEALVKFLLEEYKPTPLFSPWNGDGGFLSDSGTSVDIIKAMECSSDTRLAPIRSAIAAVRQVPLMGDFRTKRDRAKDLGKKKKAKTITEKETEELKEVNVRVKWIKQHVVNEIRGGFPDPSIYWLDACMTLNMAGFRPSPLLGSGGVDGRLDFGTNFLVNVQAVLSGQEESEKWLRQCLFKESTALEDSAIGQFSPGQIGGPNGTQGFEGASLINCWDYVLMLEGALVLAGAAVRRLQAGASARASFPFTVNAIAAGYDTSAPKDEAESRGELWLPLWSRPTAAAELRQLFGEGRAEVSSRAVRNGADFARAVAGLGVDRGVAGFCRFGFLKRSGKAYLAAPLGRFEVAEHSEVDLLLQIDHWLDYFRWKCAAGRDKEEAPKRILRTLNGIDSTIFEFCKYGGPRLFQNIVIALGRVERELAVTEGKFKKKAVTPISPLAPLWVGAANDDSAEFAVARALASIHDPQQKIGPLRVNLESVDWKKNCRAWAEKDRAVVWNAADLSTNLANVLQRRMMDGQRAGCELLPLASRRDVPLDIIAAFIAGELDDQRIEDLIWGLMLVKPPDAGGKATNAPAPPAVLPRPYALLKLLFLPGPLAADRTGDTLRWRLARDGKTGIAVRPEPRILPLLRAGRVGEACAIAARRLRASGLPTMPGPVGGRVRDFEWSEYSTDARCAQRLTAALLIPISSHSINELVHLVCRDQSAAAEALAFSTEGESE